jgi:RimJ/RimL family protein N-acetyltransferase
VRPAIAAGGLSVRAFEDRDLPALHGFHCDAGSVALAYGSVLLPPSLADTRAWVEKMRASRTAELLTVADAEDAAEGALVLQGIDWRNRTAFLGRLVYDPARRGRGAGTAVTAAAARFLFDELGFRFVYFETADFNQPAQRSLAKLGARVVGRRRDAAWHAGSFHDMILMAVGPGELRWEEAGAG